MAKTPKLKNATKPSPHSRALRHQPPHPTLSHPSTSSTHDSNPAFLAPTANAGISKRNTKKNGKRLTRKQRLRAESGKERAEDVREKFGVKVLKSEGRGGRKRGRRAKWEELNEKIGREVGGKGKVGVRKRVERGEEGEEDEWMDEEMEDEDEDVVDGSKATVGVAVGDVGEEGVAGVEEEL